MKPSIIKTILCQIPGVNLLRELRRRQHEIILIKKLSKFYSDNNLIKSGDLVFDIGSNIGSWTEAFTHLGAHVISVEPQPSCLKYLRKRFNGNRNVTIIDRAMGEKDDQIVELNICDETSTISTVSRRWLSEGRFSSEFKWSQKINVTTSTLDTLIKNYGVPAYCKIDVEGFERNVIMGLTQVIPLISIEYSKEFSDEAKQCLELIGKIYSMKVKFSQGEDFSLSTNWMSSIELFGMLEKISNPLLWGDIFIQMK